MPPRGFHLDSKALNNSTRRGCVNVDGFSVNADGIMRISALKQQLYVPYVKIEAGHESHSSREDENFSCAWCEHFLHVIYATSVGFHNFLSSPDVVSLTQLIFCLLEEGTRALVHHSFMSQKVCRDWKERTKVAPQKALKLTWTVAFCGRQNLFGPSEN